MTEEAIATDVPDTSTASEPAQETGPTADDASAFAREADTRAPGIIVEFCDFFIHNKKWWLTPIVLVLLLVLVLVLVSGSAAAPFIYGL